MVAAFSGKLEQLLYLKEIWANINICGDTKDTVLYLAAQSGRVGIIKLLMDKELLLIWPTEMTLHRYMFLLYFAVWK